MCTVDVASPPWTLWLMSLSNRSKVTNAALKPKCLISARVNGKCRLLISVCFLSIHQPQSERLSEQLPQLPALHSGYYRSPLLTLANWQHRVKGGTYYRSAGDNQEQRAHSFTGLWLCPKHESSRFRSHNNNRSDATENLRKENISLVLHYDMAKVTELTKLCETSLCSVDEEQQWWLKDSHDVTQSIPKDFHVNRFLGHSLGF